MCRPAGRGPQNGYTSLYTQKQHLPELQKLEEFWEVSIVLRELHSEETLMSVNNVPGVCQ